MKSAPSLQRPETGLGTMFCCADETWLLPEAQRPEPDANAPVSSDGESSRAHGLEEVRTQPGISEQDLGEPELSMPEPAPLGVDKKVAEKKRTEKVGAKGSTAGPPVPKSLPVQRKVEPPSLDPAEEPLLWEGLTLNKCILVASVIALLSVTFQVLQAPCSREGVSHVGQDPPPPPLHDVVSTKEEEVQEVVTAQPAQPQSSVFEDDDGDDDGDDNGDDDSEADSNLAKPWIFKKWFGRSTPEDEDEDEVEDEEPVDVPEVSPAAVEVKKSQEKKPEKKLEKKLEKKPEKKEEKERESRAAQEERSSRREARAKDRAAGDKPSRAPRVPREPEPQPQKKRGREGRERRRERDEPRKEGWKGRPGRAEGSGESARRDWRQKGRRPWEPAAAPGKDGTARPREGKRRD